VSILSQKLPRPDPRINASRGRKLVTRRIEFIASRTLFFFNKTDSVIE